MSELRSFDPAKFDEDDISGPVTELKVLLSPKVAAGTGAFSFGSDFEFVGNEL